MLSLGTSNIHPCQKFMENAGRVEYTQNEELNRIHEPGAKSRHKITEHDIDSGTPARGNGGVELIT